jgi:hypothetical protein
MVTPAEVRTTAHIGVKAEPAKIANLATLALEAPGESWIWPT